MSVQALKEGQIKEIDISYEIVKVSLLYLELPLMNIFFLFTRKFVLPWSDPHNIKIENFL